MDNPWDIFFKTGKISDYLNYIDSTKSENSVGEVKSNSDNNRGDSNTGTAVG